MSIKELLIYGFIRGIQSLLQNDKIIPLSIIEICCELYSIPLKVFSIGDIDKYETTFYAMNIETKTISQLITTSNNDVNYVHGTGWCYIPNISLKTHSTENKQNTYYDSLFCVDLDHHYPRFILFDSNQLYRNEKIINIHNMFTSEIP